MEKSLLLLVYNKTNTPTYFDIKHYKYNNFCCCLFGCFDNILNVRKLWNTHNCVSVKYNAMQCSTVHQFSFPYCTAVQYNRAHSQLLNIKTWKFNSFLYYCTTGQYFSVLASCRNNTENQLFQYWSPRKVNAEVEIENVCIVTQVRIYDKIYPEPSGYPLGFALGISLGLRLYFIVYPSSRHNTDTVESIPLLLPVSPCQQLTQIKLSPLSAPPPLRYSAVQSNAVQCSAVSYSLVYCS